MMPPDDRPADDRNPNGTTADRIEARYRPWIRWFPAAWRRQWGPELLAVLVQTATDQGRGGPNWADRLDLVGQGITVRTEQVLRPFTLPLRRRVALVALAVNAVLAATFLTLGEAVPRWQSIGTPHPWAVATVGLLIWPPWLVAAGLAATGRPGWARLTTLLAAMATAAGALVVRLQRSRPGPGVGPDPWAPGQPTWWPPPHLSPTTNAPRLWVFVLVLCIGLLALGAPAATGQRARRATAAVVGAGLGAIAWLTLPLIRYRAAPFTSPGATPAALGFRTAPETDWWWWMPRVQEGGPFPSLYGHAEWIVTLICGIALVLVVGAGVLAVTRAGGRWVSSLLLVGAPLEVVLLTQPWRVGGETAGERVLTGTGLLALLLLSGCWLGLVVAAVLRAQDQRCELGGTPDPWDSDGLTR